jgi:hypothetical protein
VVVELHHGDSGDVLRTLRPRLENTSVLYWLDAHWCVAAGTAGERSQCPLLEELQAIGSLNSSSVILIDDARLFLATPPAPHEASEWPDLHSVILRLQSLSAEHEIMVVNDVIVFFPGSIRDSVARYARSSGLDWLAQLHHLGELEAERSMMSQALAARLEMIDELTTIAEERDVVIGELSAALEECRNVQRKKGAEPDRLAQKITEGHNRRHDCRPPAT